MPNALSPVPTARRAVCYVRVSALMGRAGESFHSPETQLAAMRALGGREGLSEVAVIEDLDRSGRTFNRAGIRQIMKMARAGEVDVVCLYDLSRLGRNTAESLRHVAELRDLGVSVVSTVEKIEDSPEGQFSLTLFLGLAQLRSDQIGREWQTVIGARAQAGLHHGQVPLGYMRVDGALVPDPVAGPVVADAFRAFAAGASRIRVGRMIVDGGASKAKTIRSSTVARTLSNPFYAGQVRLGDAVVPGRHPALVDEATWERVQARLAVEHFEPRHYAEPRHPFTGLAICSYCARFLQFTIDHRKVERLRDATGRDVGCSGIGTPRLDVVTGLVLDKVSALIANLREARRSPAESAPVGDIDALDARIGRLQGALGEMLADYRTGDVVGGREAYEAATRRVNLELRTAKATRAKLLVEQAPPLAGTRLLAERLAGSWDSLTNEQRNLALRAVVTKIEVERGPVVYLIDKAGNRV